MIRHLFDLCESNNISLLIRNNLKTDHTRFSDKKYFIHVYTEKESYKIHDEIIRRFYDDFDEMLKDAEIEIKKFLLERCDEQ